MNRVQTKKTGLKIGPPIIRLPRPTRLRNFLILAFIFLSILPVATALTFGIIRAGEQSSQQVSAQLNSVLQLKIAALESNLESRQAMLRAVTGNDVVHAAMLNLIKTAGGTAVADEGTQTYLQGHLQGFLDAGGGVFMEFLLYDTNGLVVYSTSEQEIGKIVRTQPYFQHSLQEEYIQPPYYELGNNSLALIMTLPITHENGTVVGALAGRLSIDELGILMTERAGLGETGETYLISSENNYLVTPSRFAGYPLNRSYHSEAIDSVLEGENGSGTYANYRGREVIGAYQWLPELHVGVIAEYEVAEALAGPRQVLLISVLIAVLSGGAAVIAGLYLAVQITNPVSELTRATQQFAEGDLDARAAYTGTNEVGVLSAAFNQMADELQDTLKSLEASVKEARTATAMAREANRLKSEFLSTMSHELRTPLNAIVGFTEILMAGMSGEMPEKQLHKIRRIHLNSKRLLDLINDLLDLAKIEAGRVEVLHEPFSVRDLAQSIQSQTESLAEQRRLHYSVQVDPDLPPILVGDAARIEQIAKNLVSNAFKFTKEGSVELHFSANSGGAWNLSVRDTGIGIPAHALEYIFDEFRQVDGSSQRAYGGSGLGLAITRNLARIMDGDVRVTSKLGEGSTFIVTLPLVVAEPDAIVAGGRA